MSEVAAPKASFWDLYSIAYDSVRLSIPYNRLLEEIVDALPTTPSARILDLGCGTGNLEERIAMREDPVEVVGVDSSPAMLRRAKDRCVRFGRVRFLEADLERPLPFAEQAFDAVVLNNVLYSLESRAKIVAEAALMLKPGGVLVLSNPRPDANPLALLVAHFSEIVRLRGRRRLVECLRAVSIIPLAGIVMMLANVLVIMRWQRKGTYHFATEQELRSLLFWSSIETFKTAYGRQNWFVVARRAQGTQPNNQ